MLLKYCKYCGKELDSEANFCPYCMKKQTEEKEVNSPEIKKAKKKTIIIICLTAIILLATGTALLFIFSQSEGGVGKFPEPPKDEEINKPEDNTETPGGKDTINFSEYIGDWYSEDSETGNADIRVYENGGIALKILSVKDNAVRFSLTKIGEKPFNRIAVADKIVSSVTDGVGFFSFENDGWENSGTGKIKFEEDRIYIETEITKRNGSAQQSLEISCYLKKGGNPVTDIYKQLGSLLLKDFGEVRSVFGEETEEKTFSKYDGSAIYHFGSLTVNTLSDESGNAVISAFEINYNASDSAVRYEYRGLSGSSSYEDVIAEMGRPVIDTDSENGKSKEIGYGIENGFLKFQFGENLKITDIYAFITYE